ncbi:MAG: DedA family protein [Candidatus Micrarchaeaceae archaeon]
MFFLLSIFHLTYSSISHLISEYGYLSIFLLMVLESASLPIPSEILLPSVGFFSKEGILNPFLALLSVQAGSMVGVAIDYYIGMLIGKEIVVKHAARFGIKRERIEEVDEWFGRNGTLAVFIARMLPIVRGLISFPAGFAKMDQKKFYTFSFLGTLIWDSLLISFGYYFISYSPTKLVEAISLLAIVISIIYIASRKILRR